MVMHVHVSFVLLPRPVDAGVGPNEEITPDTSSSALGMALLLLIPLSKNDTSP